tara:strand:+ start:531 stop:1076 length:546 start_codon:yes stop_codon:yes gene_type:complete
MKKAKNIKDPYQNSFNRIKKITEILKTAQVSKNDHDSSQMPFFLQEPNTDFKINFNSINEDKIPQSLNRNIINIYKILGDPNKEIYINDWTIMSLNKAISIYELYCNNGQTNVFDIGFSYIGMGHINIISCDLNNHLLFYHHGGGSNGYDREESFNNIIKNGATNYNKFAFSKWFFTINNQ